MLSHRLFSLVGGGNAGMTVPARPRQRKKAEIAGSIPAKGHQTPHYKSNVRCKGY